VTSPSAGVGDPPTHLLSPVEPLRHRPHARIRLVCFPHSGGTPAAFRDWVDGLAPQAEVWSVTLPGRASRSEEPFAREFEPLTAHVAEAIRQRVPVPFALFGHSLGATVAFEVARLLERAGMSPAHLIVSGRAAPDAAHPTTIPRKDAELLTRLDQVYGGIPDAIRAEPEMLNYLLTVIRADLELSASYIFLPGPPLRVPVSALGGDSDPTVSVMQLCQWGDHTVGAFTRLIFPGAHFYLNEQQDAVIIAVRKILLTALTTSAATNRPEELWSSE